MKKFSVLTLITLLLVLACRKESTTPNRPPFIDAGDDFTINFPAYSTTLTSTSWDPDKDPLRYNWRFFSGPAGVRIESASFSGTTVYGLTYPGIYQFLLTVSDSKGLTVEDTINVTVVEPPCTSPEKEIILKDLIWTLDWEIALLYVDLFSSLQRGANFKQVFIKRDSLDLWEDVIPFNYNSPAPGKNTYSVSGNQLTITPLNSYYDDDTPDVKIVYCN